jgi:hypothetical protein
METHVRCQGIWARPDLEPRFIDPA